MGKLNIGKILVGIVCALAVLGVTVFALYLDSQSPDPIFGIFRPDSDFDRPGVEIAPFNPVPPDELPPMVEIPVLEFPCEIPEHGLIIDRMLPYTGPFVEDGTDAAAEDVAMLLIKNQGYYPVEYARITILYENKELVFDISALPVGENMVVQEKNCQKIPEGDPISANAMVLPRPEMEFSDTKVKVIENGDNTLTIQNLTDEMLPTVRVFYKYYMEDEDVFVGGIAFTVRITRLGAGDSITIQPTHYNSQTSRVVMVLTYDSEV